MAHHTKDKGDFAVAAVVKNLIFHDIQVCFPLSEHLPFDLIAVNLDDFRLAKIQVKYSSLNKGVATLTLRSSYADRNGSHPKTVDRSTFDAYAVYCPDVDQVYYVRVCEIPETYKNRMILRVETPKNNQAQNVNFAKSYLGASRIFE